jgi:hypothetical protein
LESEEHKAAAGDFLSLSSPLIGESFAFSLARARAAPQRALKHEQFELNEERARVAKCFLLPDKKRKEAT